MSNSLNKLLKSSFVVSGLTMLSRLFGFLRDMIIANKLGTSAASDAFFVALMIPNMLRRIFAEGAFNVSFVPIFTDLKNDKTARQFANSSLTLLTVVLLVIIGLAEIFMSEIIQYVIAPGIAKNAENLALATMFSRISFPYIIFITYASLAGSLSNIFGRFAPFAGVPILLNVAFIGALFILPEFGIENTLAATLAIPIGGIMQAGFMFYALRKIDFKLRFTREINTKQTRSLLHRMGPAVLSLGVLQLSFLIDIHLVSQLGDEFISYMNYANRFYQLPLSVIGIAMATVLLPHFSRTLKHDNKLEANQAFTKAMTYGLLLSSASAAGLFMLAAPLMATFFQHGEFSQLSVNMSAGAMMAFSLGLPAFVLTKITTTAFFANHDTKTPFYISIFILILNVILNIILMKEFLHVGIALATAISGWCNAIIQLSILRYKKVLIVDKLGRFLGDLVKIFIATVAIVISISLFSTEFIFLSEDSSLQKMLWLGGAVATGFVSFLIVSMLGGLVKAKYLLSLKK